MENQNNKSQQQSPNQKNDPQPRKPPVTPPVTNGRVYRHDNGIGG